MTDYAGLARQLEALLDTRDWVANTAQTAAFVFHSVPDVNWVGFYLQREPETLVLGSFQGKPACNPIAFGDGVCGTAASTGATRRIADVTALDNHITCDPASRSELVVPICIADGVWGVLDIDSPYHDRFGAEDQVGIERLVGVFSMATDLKLRSRVQRQSQTPASVTT